MKSQLPIKTYEAPNPGPSCPECHSHNTSYGGYCEGEYYWSCFECGELFKRGQAYKPEPYTPRIYGKVDAGVWFTNNLGLPFFISNEALASDQKKQQMRDEFEKEWPSIWARIQAQINLRQTLKSLTQSQLKEVLNGTKTTNL